MKAEPVFIVKDQLAALNVTEPSLGGRRADDERLPMRLSACQVASSVSRVGRYPVDRVVTNGDESWGRRWRPLWASWQPGTVVRGWSSLRKGDAPRFGVWPVMQM